MPVLADRDEVPGEPGKSDLRGLSSRGLRSDDLDLMHRWLNAPHVRRRWYDERTSRPEIEGKYLPLIEGRDTARPFVILHEDRPIGYVQPYRISDEDGQEYASLVDAGDSSGVDLLFGGGGVPLPGTRAVRRLGLSL